MQNLRLYQSQSDWKEDETEGKPAKNMFYKIMFTIQSRNEEDGELTVGEEEGVNRIKSVTAIMST